jgi:hypothetical protein
MNAASSRSHLVFTLRVRSEHAATRQAREGTLVLVDLAGSERLAKSGADDEAAGGSRKLAGETVEINKSLLALSNVVTALQAKAAHVPYRDSKLTHLLANALGAEDARTLFICSLNPLHANASESREGGGGRCGVRGWRCTCAPHHPPTPHHPLSSDATFRSMWADFEWENKVSVNTNIT